MDKSPIWSIQTNLSNPAARPGRPHFWRQRSRVIAIIRTCVRQFDIRAGRRMVISWGSTPVEKRRSLTSFNGRRSLVRWTQMKLATYDLDQNASCWFWRLFSLRFSRWSLRDWNGGVWFGSAELWRSHLGDKDRKSKRAAGRVAVNANDWFGFIKSILLLLVLHAGHL